MSKKKSSKNQPLIFQVDVEVAEQTFENCRVISAETETDVDFEDYDSSVENSKLPVIKHVR